MSIYEDFHKRRNEGNEKILSADNLVLKRFFNIDTRCYESGSIPRKYKELLGLVASAVLRCNDCIFYHIEQAKLAGATREEIEESLNVALVVGGSIVIPHLRQAYSALDELFTTQDEKTKE
jgi:AhpD family alkylhydroperoxidase